MSEIVRPNPFRWLLYAMGTGLPARHKGWVMHDVTARTWQLRHIARATVQLFPVAVLLYIFIPGQPWVRAMAVLAGLLLGYFYSVAYMYESAEHRAMKAGFPHGAAAMIRDESHADERREQEERYAARWRQS